MGAVSSPKAWPRKGVYPAFATAGGFVGITLALDGRTEQALLHFAKNVRRASAPRDPFDAIFFAGIAVAHCLDGRFDDAVRWARPAASVVAEIFPVTRTISTGARPSHARGAVRAQQRCMSVGSRAEWQRNDRQVQSPIVARRLTWKPPVTRDC
jgi:hypothetical protein